jgi:hypothetical protein
MAGELLTFSSGTQIVAYTPAEVDAIGDSIDRAEASTAQTTGPCNADLSDQLFVMLQIWDEISANTFYSRVIWGQNVPAEFVGGAWLTRTDHADLAAALREFVRLQGECEDTDDPSRWIVDPDVTDGSPPAEDPIAIPSESATSATLTATTVGLGLAVAAGSVLFLYLIMRGRR